MNHMFSYIDTPAVTTDSAGFGIQGYACSDSEDDEGFLYALGLHSTSVPRPGVEHHHIIVDKAICII